MKLRRVLTKDVVFGGEEHTGWLPPGAARPLRTPIRRETVDFELIQESGGYLLAWTVRPASPDTPLDSMRGNDLWFQTLDEALAAATESFGIDPSDWRAENEPNPPVQPPGDKAARG